MIRIGLVAAVASVALAACQTHAPQPRAYPGSTTGILEYVNNEDERYAVSAARCGQENAQTYVVLGETTNTLKIEPGTSEQVEMTVGCYELYTGPDRMSTQGKIWKVQIRDAAEGLTRVVSDGAPKFVAPE